MTQQGPDRWPVTISAARERPFPGVKASNAAQGPVATVDMPRGRPTRCADELDLGFEEQRELEVGA